MNSFWRPVFRFMNISLDFSMQSLLSVMMRSRVVGTINLDYRSLYLHFEDGVWFYKNDVVQDILKDFQETLNYCDPISIEFCKNRNIIVRVFRVLCGYLLHCFDFLSVQFYSVLLNTVLTIF